MITILPSIFRPPTHKVVKCPKDWSGNIIFQQNCVFQKLKEKNMIIIFLKEKGECAYYFL